MNPLVTVLYEDSKLGKEFPLHRLVLRMVEDEINGATWKITNQVAENPRNGVDNVLRDVRSAALTAGRRYLFVLVDRDKLVAHVNKNAKPGEARLSPNATDDELLEAVRSTAGEAADRVRVFLLKPNMEGLIRTIGTCETNQPVEYVARAKAKDRIARDLVLSAAAKSSMASLRACIRRHQPGLDALARALVEVVPTELIA